MKEDCAEQRVQRAYIKYLFRAQGWYFRTICSKNKTRSVKILFLGDTIDSKGMDYSPENDLLLKIIKAMKLKDLTWIRHYEKDLKNQTCAQRFLAYIEQYKPCIVVTFGSVATSILLGRVERLSLIHGKFISQQARTWSYMLCPIFHLDYIASNLNMKKTAWIDLQKVISYLK